MEISSKEYPKVLIVGETFTDTDGGGITLSNLFNNWPEDKIANAVDGNRISAINRKTKFKNIYSIGGKEKYTLPLFAFFRSKHPSGIVDLKLLENTDKNGKLKKKGNGLRQFVLRCFYNSIDFLGVYSYIFKLKVSDDFIKWVKQFNPDYLYVQFNTLEMIEFVKQLQRTFNKPIVIHMMDDWPSVIIKPGPFSYWQKRKLDNDLKLIFGKAHKLLSISEGMTKAYKLRYNMEFIPFHNPISLAFWQSNSRQNRKLGNPINFLYAGRIGSGMEKSFLMVANAIEDISNRGYNSVFTVQSNSISNRIINPLSKISVVKIANTSEYNELPKIFANADFLLLPYDFNSVGESFIKYSMPTKLPEYMASGTPIIIFSSPNTYVAEIARANGLAFTITDSNTSNMSKKLIELIENDELRCKLTENAKKYVQRNFSDEIVRDKFLKVFHN